MLCFQNGSQLKKIFKTLVTMYKNHFIHSLQQCIKNFLRFLPLFKKVQFCVKIDLHPRHVDGKTRIS